MEHLELCWEKQPRRKLTTSSTPRWVKVLGVVALVLVLLVFIMMFVGVVGTVLVVTHCP